MKAIFQRCDLLMSVCLAVWAVQCSDGQRLDLGEDHPLRVRDATYFRSPLPRGEAEPQVLSATFTSRIFPETTQHKGFKGTLGVDATSVAIALGQENGVDAAGHWLLPANAPFVETPDFPSFATSLSFGHALLAGAYTLSLTAIDGDGRPGSVRDVLFQLTERPPTTGVLVFSLDWSTDADLDIHVLTPHGNEIYQADVREPATASTAGGALDFDSNGDCRIDGRRNENVVWTSKPAAGRYVVRVDAFSLCGQHHAHWRVTALYNDRLVAATTGMLLPTDTRGDHGRGAGLTVMELTIR